MLTLDLVDVQKGSRARRSPPRKVLLKAQQTAASLYELETSLRQAMNHQAGDQVIDVQPRTEVSCQSELHARPVSSSFPVMILMMLSRAAIN